MHYIINDKTTRRYRFTFCDEYGIFFLCVFCHHTIWDKLYCLTVIVCIALSGLDRTNNIKRCQDQA